MIRRRFRRDPSEQSERAARVIRDLYEETALAMDSGPLAYAKEVGAVLADAIEAHGYRSLAEGINEAIQSADKGKGWQWHALDNEIDRTITQIASGREPLLQDEYFSQGYAPSHRESPYDPILKRAGYKYSHSTRVWRATTGHLLHTYTKLGVQPISVSGKHWSTRARAFRGSREVSGETPAELEKYLRGKARRKPRRP